MRTKLSEIVSTIDQYNGQNEYAHKYDGGEQIDIDTKIPGCPTKVTVPIGRKPIKEMRGNIRKFENHIAKHEKAHVLPLEDFLKEQKGAPLNVQSYFGRQDEEEEE